VLTVSELQVAPGGVAVLQARTLLTDGVSEPLDFEASFNKQYVKQKLGNGLVRIWHEVRTRVLTYLLGSDLSWYKFDEFLHVLGIVHRFVLWGHVCPYSCLQRNCDSIFEKSELVYS
jgi:hypothetical protein